MPGRKEEEFKELVSSQSITQGISKGKEEDRWWNSVTMPGGRPGTKSLSSYY